MGTLIQNWFFPSPRNLLFDFGSFLSRLSSSLIFPIDLNSIVLPFALSFAILSFWRSSFEEHLSVDPIAQVFPSTLLFRNCLSGDFDASLLDRCVCAISLLSNSPNQNDLILVHFLQFHFRSTSVGVTIYDDIYWIRNIEG